MDARIHAILAALLLLLCGACTIQGPQQVSALSTYDICETQVNQSWNLSDEARRALQGELDRRKENCGPHRSAIRAARDEELYDRMYRNQSP